MKLGRFILWRAAAISAVANIDSGGGSAAVGGMTHHASIGSAFATGDDSLAVDDNKSELPPKNTLDSTTLGDTVSPYFPDNSSIHYTLDSLMKSLSPWFCRLAFFLSLLATALLPQANGANDFVTTGGRVVSADTATYTLLPNGKVLVVGGYMTVGNNALQTNLGRGFFFVKMLKSIGAG